MDMGYILTCGIKIILYSFVQGEFACIVLKRAHPAFRIIITITEVGRQLDRCNVSNILYYIWIHG